MDRDDGVTAVWYAALPVLAMAACAQAPSHGGALFADDFESGTLAAWQDGVDTSRQHVVRDPAAARSGTAYLDVTYPAGRDGGWLTRFLTPGRDSLYVSLYVRFPAGWSGGTKLVALYGARADDRWSALGQAGKCPLGSDFFETAVVTDLAGDPGPLRFYTYYPGMPKQSDGVTCYGVFGDSTTVYAPLAPSAGAWHHVEFAVVLNTPGHADGCQELWLDGVRRGSWSGLAFRTSPALQLDAVQLSFSRGTALQSQHLYVDDVVAAVAPPGGLTCAD